MKVILTLIIQKTLEADDDYDKEEQVQKLIWPLEADGWSVSVEDESEEEDTS